MNTLIQTPRLFFLGDSHTNMWRFVKKNNLSKKFTVSGVSGIRGKTAQGLAKQDNIELFVSKLSNKAYDYICLNFGEVDCAYTVWSRIEINNTNKEDEVLFAIKQISKLADRSLAYADNIILLAPIIPLIEDYNDGMYVKANNKVSSEKANAARKKRREVKASFIERTLLTLEFESQLLSLSIQKGFKFATINHKLYNQNTGVVHEKFMNLGHGWHLPPEVASNLWIEEIEKII